MTARGTQDIGNTDPRAIASQYRRARLYLGVALLLLAGTVLYLVAIGGQQIWTTARTSLLDLALDLEGSITGTLEQTALNLRGISEGLGDEAHRSSANLSAALGQVIRFDANAAYLGIARADGTIVAVDRTGRAAPAEVAEALRPLVPERQRESASTSSSRCPMRPAGIFPSS